MKKIIDSAMFLSLIIVLEWLLAPIPNVQLTTLLFVLFFVNNNVLRSFALTLAYVLLQGMSWGWGIYLLPMFIGWCFLALFVSLCLPYNKRQIIVSVALFSVFYSLVFLPFDVLVYGINPVVYLLQGVWFYALFLISNLVSVGLLYSYCNKVYRMYLRGELR